MMKWLELRIPPVVLLFGCAALMWQLAVWLPQPGWPAGNVWCGLLVLAGAAVSISGVVTFRLARTTANPLQLHRSSSLVQHGIYRFSRNPMYLGFVLALAGEACWLGSLAAFSAIVLLIVWLNRFQIAAEERALQQLFGEPYRQYCQRVRRWL